MRTRMLPPALTLLLLSLGCLLLLPAVDAKKKSPARKVGFLKTAEKRSKYATWVFDQYDEDENGKLSEVEVDEANDLEPPVQISKDAEDTLELFDLDLLDKDPVDKRVSREELLAKLANVEERRLAALAAWDEHEKTVKDMWDEFDRLHTISATHVNPTVRTQGGGSRVTHQRREKISPEDMQYMIDKYGKLLHLDTESMWNNWADFCGNRMSTKNPEYAAEQGRPIDEEQESSADKEL